MQLHTVRQFSQKHPIYSEGSIRHVIFNAKTNGFAPAIVRQGRRVLIDESAWFECLKRQQKEAA